MGISEPSDNFGPSPTSKYSADPLKVTDTKSNKKYIVSDHKGGVIIKYYCALKTYGRIPPDYQTWFNSQESFTDWNSNGSSLVKAPYVSVTLEAYFSRRFVKKLALGQGEC
ncbi:Uncharacterised protein [Scardovia inopinata]|uniref:Uncharacterized protein n=1 Tax=Scardovia inopinata F0304 TaxID=641146 RepID=W1MXF2_SCAIO|nr:hypothetical protein [Scardovia inopinata]EQW12971.1 hypothetical protein HMPREF9020_01564 [Scardovia inopinata F0304]SUV51137.1 Uncharacterised protein [Scardovia inopinata]